jgi:hypothetical protein
MDALSNRNRSYAGHGICMLLTRALFGIVLTPITTPPRKSLMNLKAILATLAIAATMSGCVIATGGEHTVVTGQSGASICQASTDGHAVACGGKANFCQASTDGRAVACGGAANYCQSSTDGHAIACGGQASVCQTSTDGRAVACGGKATACMASSDGSAVACGGAR